MGGWQIAFETSSRPGSVALLRQDVTIKQIVLPTTVQTAQSIAPAVSELLTTLGHPDQRLDFISVSQGPGSFTGLRIGVTAAKSLAFALNVPVVVCDTLQAIIGQCREACPKEVLYDAVINAYRGQVFWRREARDGTVLEHSQAIDQTDWWRVLHRSHDQVFAVGDLWDKGLQVPNNVALGPKSLWTAMATSIGQLAWKQFQLGALQDPMTVVPNYLRESAATEKKRQTDKNEETSA